MFYSDNCCGQQKNQFIFSMYIYAVQNLPNIKSITHKFLIKGHTQNEGDSVHSTIERQIKRRLRRDSQSKQYKNFEKSDSDLKVFYKTSFKDVIFKELKLLKLRRAIRPQLIPLYNARLPLAANKKKDLEDLIKKKAILPYYVSSYYNHIL
ncbi:hypothetical protein ACJJTC_009612 [Scirpophaga incertulas]